MQAQNYGRIVMTTSSSGLYGNFGQSNYGAAKMALVGLMQTLALEGAKYHIHVNALAPTAATRMTEGLMPEAVLAALKPKAVVPAMLVLAHTSAPTRTILCAGAGSFEAAHITLTQGVYVGMGRQPLSSWCSNCMLCWTRVMLWCQKAAWRRGSWKWARPWLRAVLRQHRMGLSSGYKLSLQTVAMAAQLVRGYGEGEAARVTVSSYDFVASGVLHAKVAPRFLTVTADKHEFIAQTILLPAAERLAGIRRGIEKEGLRVLPTGSLALTPHPVALGAALTHPHITTDYSESQLELITGVHQSVEACLQELQQVHQYTLRSMAQVSEEMIWNSSMPCHLPTDETIPLARYGSSHAGRSKSVYRMGLGHRYGRRMQTISGIHYNWSMPGVSSEEYFALIRNFRRNAFVLLYLFGASPALGRCFVEGREHRLQPLDAAQKTLHLPYATSLRMGRLGYQSDAQAQIKVSYNGLEGYAHSCIRR